LTATVIFHLLSAEFQKGGFHGLDLAQKAGTYFYPHDPSDREKSIQIKTDDSARGRPKLGSGHAP